MGGEGWMVSDEKQGMEIMQRGKVDLGKAIISDSSLIWPYRIPSKKWIKTAGGGKQRMAMRQHQKEKTAMSHCLILCTVCVCVFFQANKENNKKISLSSCNSQTALLHQITVCSPGVNIGCWCDMLGDMCSSPECYSVHAVKGARSQAAGRTPVSKGTSQDRPLKWCQTTDWQHRWTADSNAVLTHG